MSAADLTQTRVTLALADERLAAAHRAIRKQEATFALAQSEVDRLTADLAARTAAALMGDAPAVDGEVDGVAILGLRQVLNTSEAAMAELRQHVTHRQSHAENARREHYTAVRAYLKEHAIEPARAELATAWEAVGEALGKLMAASYVSDVKFGDPARTYLPTWTYGPAEEFLTRLWQAHLPKGQPFDASPPWSLSSKGPGAFGGCDAQVRELADRIEAAGAEL